MKNKKILELQNISYKVLNLLGTNEINILENVNGIFYENQITGIIGKSGAGKSCLLKIIAGLLKQTSGKIKFNLTGPFSQIKTSLVFQDFALFPWLNVQENIALGLRSFSLSEKEIDERSMEMIELVGLEGFENSYPKELAGGMKQRVSFARAVVSEPDILLMDEPFASLDILTAESLRSDFLELWSQKLLPIKAIILVTHDINDLVSMCNKVCFMEGKTGQFYKELEIDLPYPRMVNSSKYHQISKKIYKNVFLDFTHDYAYKIGQKPNYKIFVNICRINVFTLIGFLELINKIGGTKEVEIASFATQLDINPDDITGCLELAKALNFIKLKNAEVKLTAFGKNFISITPNEQKIIFATKLRKYISIVNEFERIFNKQKSLDKAIEKLGMQLNNHLDKQKTQQVIKGLLDWVKFAEII